MRCQRLSRQQLRKKVSVGRKVCPAKMLHQRETGVTQLESKGQQAVPGVIVLARQQLRSLTLFGNWTPPRLN
jgi:hypothetical protein